MLDETKAQKEDAEGEENEERPLPSATQISSIFDCPSCSQSRLAFSPVPSFIRPVLLLLFHRLPVSASLCTLAASERANVEPLIDFLLPAPLSFGQINIRFSCPPDSD